MYSSRAYLNLITKLITVCTDIAKVVPGIITFWERLKNKTSTWCRLRWCKLEWFNSLTMMKITMIPLPKLYCLRPFFHHVQIMLDTCIKSCLSSRFNGSYSFISKDIFFTVWSDVNLSLWIYNQLRKISARPRNKLHSIHISILFILI